MRSKVCSICRETKPITDYYFSKTSLDGRIGHCKFCERQRKLAYYHKNKDECSVRAKSFRERNREHFREYQKNKIQQDSNFRLARNLRNRINQQMRKAKGIRSGSAVRDLGCTIGELRVHLQLKFQPGMSWENYGEWHIDHITPLASFDLADREQFLQACHYTNLQPLWAEENWTKGNRYANTTAG